MMEYRTSIKDIEMSDIKDIVSQNSSKDSKFDAVLRKTEKLVSALYLVTGFMNDKEPLKWRVRSMGSELLRSVIAGRQSLELSSGRLSESIEGIKSHLRVARDAALISPMNENLISKEFTSLTDLIDEDRSFTVLREEPQSQIYLKDNIEDKRQYLPIPEKKPIVHRETGMVTAKKNSRQTIILDLVKKNKEIMIKDAIPLIKGCSEKTIQRELLSMVKSGILRKVGEKRWSRYSLA